MVDVLKEMSMFDVTIIRNICINTMNEQMVYDKNVLKVIPGHGNSYQEEAVHLCLTR